MPTSVATVNMRIGKIDKSRLSEMNNYTDRTIDKGRQR
jgi:hypothetical protein